MLNVHLFIVDPQNDFCIANDGNGNRGSLVVDGADQDMIRLSTMIDRLAPKLDDIHVSMDSHQSNGIERPNLWKRVSDGASPDPFTCLGIHPDGRRIVKYAPGGSTPNAFGMSPTEEEYTARIPAMLHQGGATGKGYFGYLQALAARGRYPHIIWPVHCVVGTWGWSMEKNVSRALCNWERTQYGKVNIIAKGNNPDTEHFSAVAAEVPDPRDPSTQINTNLISVLESATDVLLTGEALSHCVANTCRGIVDAFSDPTYVRKITLLTDTTSNVGGFDFLGKQFVQDLQNAGMKTALSTDIFA